MARPTTHDEELRDHLIVVTAAVIEQDGPASVSLRDVAREAGTSTSAVYSLFGGKPELITAVVRAAFASFGSSQLEAEPRGLRALGVAYRAWALAHPTMYRLMFGGSLTAHVPDDDGSSAAEDTLLPLLRTVSALHPDEDLPSIGRRAVVIWAQVHGAVGLQLADVAPAAIDWDAAYGDVLDQIQRDVRR